MSLKLEDWKQELMRNNNAIQLNSTALQNERMPSEALLWSTINTKNSEETRKFQHEKNEEIGLRKYSSSVMSQAPSVLPWR